MRHYGITGTATNVTIANIDSPRGVQRTRSLMGYPTATTININDDVQPNPTRGRPVLANVVTLNRAPATFVFNDRRQVATVSLPPRGTYVNNITLSDQIYPDLDTATLQMLQRNQTPSGNLNSVQVPPVGNSQAMTPSGNGPYHVTIDPNYPGDLHTSTQGPLSVDSPPGYSTLPPDNRQVVRIDLD